MDIQTILATDLRSTLGLDYLDLEKRVEFLNNLGDVILEGAILRYLEETEEADQLVFNSWVQAHANDEKLLPRLLSVYPRFETFLTDEILAFKTDALRVGSA